MNIGARPETAGQGAPGSADGQGKVPQDGAAQGTLAPDAAGQLLRRLSVLPALLVMSWLLAGFGLLLAGHFTPVLTFVLALVVAAVLVPLGLRLTGKAPPGTERTPWWTVAAVLAIAVAFCGDQVAYHSQFIVVMRDPASYFQFAEWLSRHGSLPIPQDRAALGRRERQRVHLQQLRLLPGRPQRGPAVHGRVADGAGGRDVAGRRAPRAAGSAGARHPGAARLRRARVPAGRAGADATAVRAPGGSLPQQFTSRSNYSEPLAQILFLGGLCLVIDSLSRGRGDRLLAALGGLALGLTVLVRIDGASDVLPVVPYCGLLLLGRRRQALPLIGGAAVGAAYAAVDGGVLLTRPYLAANKSSVIPLALLGALVVVVTLAALPLLWKRSLPQVKSKRLLNVAGALPVLIICAFAIRPYVHQAHAAQSKATKHVIASYQRDNHQPISPTRTYAEISLHWVFWYIGLPAVIRATLAAVLLTRRCLRGQAPLWTLPLLTFGWAIVTFLYRPAITPDQPWASRRLVPAVLPGFILLAVWGSSWLIRWLREHGYAGLPSAVAGVVLAVALVLPGTMTTFGLGVRTGGPLGVTLTADGLAFKTTYWGELGAVEGMCSDIPKNSSVVIVDGPIADRFEQIVRGMCGYPTVRYTPTAGGLRPPSPARLEKVVQGIRRAGRRPVLLGASASELKPDGGLAKEVMNLHTQMDTSTLVTPPKTTKPLKLTVWLSEPASLTAIPETATSETATSQGATPQAATGEAGAAEIAPYVTIILPCYNEQGHVTAEIERICAAMDGSGYTYELVAFDDKSTDETLAGATRPRPRFPHLEIVPFQRNGGSGTVRRIGTQRARGQIVVWTDADMTYPNERIPELVQILEKDPEGGPGRGRADQRAGHHKMLRVPAKWLDPQARGVADQRQDSRPELRAAGVPARGGAAVPAPAAARLLLRHHHHRGVPVQPARGRVRADRVRQAGGDVEVQVRPRRLPLHPAGAADGHVLQPAQGADARSRCSCSAWGSSRASMTWSCIPCCSRSTPC